MASYVDGFVLTVPRKKLAAYRKMALQAGKIWRKSGALDYKECVGDDMQKKWGVPFPKLARSRPGELVFFSFIVYKSRAHRDRVNAKVMKQLEKLDMCKDMPFDMKRMSFGGFKAIVDL